MPTPQPPSGVAYLHHRSRIAAGRHRLPPIRRVLILSGSECEAAALAAMLRLLLGYDLAVQAAMTLGAALDGLGSEPPDLVLLAGRLGPQADAPAVLGILAKLGCRAPVIALVDRCDREAGRALMAASAIGVIERDDLSASRLLEALLDGLPQVAAAETC